MTDQKIRDFREKFNEKVKNDDFGFPLVSVSEKVVSDFFKRYWEYLENLDESERMRKFANFVYNISFG